MMNPKTIYRSISSMKTGLILLVLIALTSALGSAVSPEAFYKTIVFKLMLLLLLLNMLLCTLNRLNWFKRVYFKDDHIRKGWLRQIGLLLLHAGIMLILIGGTVYAYYGQNSEISIAREETVDVANVIKTKEPFSLYLDDFKIEFNENGSPSQYYSYVTILENGQAKIKESISVNHPLKYNAVKAYQQSFGYLAKVKHVVEGQEVETSMYEGDSIELSGTKRVVKFYRYLPDFDPAKGMNQTSWQPNNPRIVYSVYEDNKLLGVGAAQFGEKVDIDTNASIVFTGVEPYTVLKVKSDPGISLALAGGLLFMIGVSAAIFLKL